MVSGTITTLAIIEASHMDENETPVAAPEVAPEAPAQEAPAEPAEETKLETDVG